MVFAATQSLMRAPRRGEERSDEVRARPTGGPAAATARGWRASAMPTAGAASVALSYALSIVRAFAAFECSKSPEFIDGAWGSACVTHAKTSVIS